MASGDAFVLFALIVGAALLLPALSKAKESATRTQCMNNVRHLQIWWDLYATDNSGMIVSPVGDATESFNHNVSGCWVGLLPEKRKATSALRPTAASTQSRFGAVIPW